MSTYSDILAGIRANAGKTPQGDGKSVLAKFLNGTIGKPDKPTAPTDEQQPADAPADTPENAEIPPAPAPECAEGTDGATETETPAEGAEGAESDTPENTASAGALPEPDDDDVPPPPPPPTAEKPRANRNRRGK